MKTFGKLTKRERLELAAKAAGLESKWDQPRGASWGMLRVKSGDFWPTWNPCDDDAESFRLGAMLNIQIEHGGLINGCTTEVKCWPFGRSDCSASRKYGDDKLAAIRHATFEAAVLIGMSMAG